MNIFSKEIKLALVGIFATDIPQPDNQKIHLLMICCCFALLLLAFFPVAV